jgi:hypothetical protein
MKKPNKKEVSSLHSGAALKALVEGYRARVTADTRRIMSKDRMLRIRSKEYVDAQFSPHVRSSIEHLVGRREWRYVSFAQFSRTLVALGERFFKTLRRDPTAQVCFVVDSLRNGVKSSFWVVVMLLLALMPSDAMYERLSLAVDDDGANGGLYSAFQRLPPSARLVLTDDATYSGEQLSRFLILVKESWRNAHPGVGTRNPTTTVLVPYMSLHSYAILREIGGKSTTILRSETFPSLFHHRPLARVLSSDLYLEGRTVLGTEYRSLYFDVLGVLPTNSLFLFKPGSAISGKTWGEFSIYHSRDVSLKPVVVSKRDRR